MAEHSLPDEINSFLQTLDRSKDTATMVVNETGKVILFNPGCEKLLGFNSGEVVGNQVSDLLAEEDEEATTNTFLPQGKDQPGSIRAKFKVKGGDNKELNWNILYSGQEDDTELAICLADPGDSGELEDQANPQYNEVKETAEKYKTLFQYAYDAILLSNFETDKIFEPNPEAENLLGYQTEELIQKKLPYLLADGDFPQLKEQLESGRFFYREDQPLTKKDGFRIVASMSSSLIEF